VLYEFTLLIALVLMLWIIPSTRLFKNTTLIIKAVLLLDILFFIAITLFSILVK
jgi:predicted membrane protein